MDCWHQVEKVSRKLTYILFDSQSRKSSAKSTNSIVHPNLHTVQNPEQPIISIMEKRPPEPWLTNCLKCRAAYCQHLGERLPGPWLTSCLKPTPYFQYHAEKVAWTLTYSLFKNQSSPWSASCRKSRLYPDLLPVKTQSSPLSAPWRIGHLDPDLHPVQNSDHSIVSAMQKSLLNPALPPVQIKMQSSPLSALCRKSLLHPDLQTAHNPAHCQHDTEMTSCTMTYRLFKTQSSQSSAPCREGLLTLTYVLFKAQSKPWSVSCRKGLLTLAYILFKTQSSPLSASCRKGDLDSDLHAVWN